MFVKYFKIAFRNLLKNKLYSFINIFGLASGLSVTIIIMLWITNELSFDRFHEKADRIHQVYQTVFLDDGAQSTEKSSGPLAIDLKAEFPEIQNSARLGFLGDRLLRFEDKFFIESQGAGVDPSFLDIFTFPLKTGNIATALTNPHSVVITEALATKYFGDENPIGKSITIDNNIDFQVTGVLKNIPSNSHRRFSFLVPFSYFRELGASVDQYNNTAFFTYVLLHQDAAFENVSEKIYTTFTKASDESGINRNYYLMPLSQTYLKGDQGPGMFSIYLLSVLAIFILIVACINFINLSTAQSARRVREICMKKIAGARRHQLIWQFLSESLFTTIIAGLAALLITESFLPVINRLFGKSLAINYTNFTFILEFSGLILITALLAGSYPALHLSAVQPLKLMQNNIHSGKKAAGFRKVLVGIQFTITIIFIIFSVVTYLQSRYMENADLGFSNENIMYIQLRGDISEKIDLVKQALLSNPAIANVTSASHLPQLMMSGTLDWGAEAGQKNQFAWWTEVDYDYAKTFEIEMAQGRFYSKEFPSDWEDAIVVDETTIDLLGWDNPIGKRFFYENRYYTLIGVIKNFHCFPMTFIKGGLILKLNPGNNKYLFIKMKPGDSGHLSQTFNYIKKTCDQFSPDYPLNYRYLDDYAFEDIEQAKAGDIIVQVIMYFTVLGIFISCLGLFGLSAFMTETRTKEIGIRKVLGATAANVIRLFSKEFIKVIGIAFLIATPISYFIVNGMLQIYAYRISISPWIFLSTGFFVLLMALLTVCWQALRAATANPVDSLRYE